MSLPRVRLRHIGFWVAALTVVVFAAEAAWADRYSDAVAHEGRPAGDLKRDVIDHPAEVLRLAGIRPGMTVVDFLAADGYYSELASYIVGPHGHVYMLNNVAYDKWSNEDWQGRVDGRRLPNVEHRTIVVEHSLGVDTIALVAMVGSLALHQELAALGIELMDTPSGTRWRVAD